MVSAMETNAPIPDRSQASAALAAAQSAQDSIRSQPWPWWLYVTNGLFLGVSALVPLLGRPGSGLLVVLVIAACAFNYWAGSRMGLPFAVPRSRIFIGALIFSTLFLVASLAASWAGTWWLVWVSAAGTVLSFGTGSVFHYRATHR